MRCDALLQGAFPDTSEATAAASPLHHIGLDFTRSLKPVRSGPRPPCCWPLIAKSLRRERHGYSRSSVRARVRWCAQRLRVVAAIVATIEDSFAASVGPNATAWGPWSTTDAGAPQAACADGW